MSKCPLSTWLRIFKKSSKKITYLGRGPDRVNLDNININDVLGDYMLTLVDSLSTLAVFGNSSEFKRAARLVAEHLNFEKNNTVQVFEATIRVLGGLLSAHMIAVDQRRVLGDMLPDGYQNELLVLAHDLGKRLLVAFEDRQDVQLPFPRVIHINLCFYSHVLTNQL